MSDEIDVHAILEPAATRVRDPVSGRSIWFSNMIQSPTKIIPSLLKFSTQKNIPLK